MILHLSSRSVGVNVHPTYNIFDSSHIFLPFWFVSLSLNDCLCLLPRHAHRSQRGALVGPQALEKIVAARDNNITIDLLITDIQMRGLTGLELIDELNRMKMDIPIFVITGYGDKGLVIELLRRIAPQRMQGIP